MDGNGRWAQRRGLPTAAGHRAGARTLRRIVEASIDLGIDDARRLRVLDRELVAPARGGRRADGDLRARRSSASCPTWREQGVRVRFIGRRDRAPEELRAAMAAIEDETAAERPAQPVDRVRLRRPRGARRGRAPARRERGRPATRSTRTCSRRTSYAPELPDPDLLIRTSGELRISNFLLWQLAYAELVFVDTLWPDFGPRDLEHALDEYASRRRRFGGR